MSSVPKETIEVIAQSLSINLSSEVANALAPDVEYRVREIMQVYIYELPHYFCPYKVGCNIDHSVTVIRILENL